MIPWCLRKSWLRFCKLIDSIFEVLVKQCLKIRPNPFSVIVLRKSMGTKLLMNYLWESPSINLVYLSSSKSLSTVASGNTLFLLFDVEMLFQSSKRSFCLI